VVLGQGNTSFTLDWQQAFPAIRVVEDNPVGAMIAQQDEPFARKARLASEIHGWGREICGYHNTCWGAQFLGRMADGKPFPKRQFTVPFPCVCDSHIKRGQQCRDFEPISRWTNDFTMYIGAYDEKREEALLDHRNYNSLKQLNEMETAFGQKLDDEILFEMARAGRTVKKYKMEISNFMRFKPSPLSVKDLYSFFQLGGLAKLGPGVAEHFWKTLRDEVEWRVQNKIAAVGNERFRWIEAHPPSWHFLKYYRYMEKYGAICLGSQYAHSCEFELKPDGTIGDRDDPAFPPDIELKTREDAVRFMTTPDARSPHHFKIDEYLRPYALNEFAEIFKADGALFGLWRAGVGCTITRKEQAMRLREAGYSVMCYEGAQPGDRVDFDEKRMLEQLDTWMESLGLQKPDE
jgi:benzoyl-CoA reductase subunit B